MRDRQTCIGCGKQSPETDTNYTLISAQFGWRLTRYRNAQGTIIVEWRCPTCWKEYKKARGDAAPPSTELADPAKPGGGMAMGRLAAEQPPSSSRSHVSEERQSRSEPVRPKQPPPGRTR